MKHKIFILILFSLFSCQNGYQEAKKAGTKNDSLQDITSKIVKQNDTINLDSIQRRNQVIESFKFEETKEYQQFKDSLWLKDELYINIDDSFNDGQFYAFVNIGKPFGTEEPESFFYIYHNQRDIWKLVSKNKWKDRFEKLEYIYTKDIDFDSKQELILKYHIYSASRTICVYEIFLYEDLALSFKHLETLYSTDSLHINYKDKTLMVGVDGGNFGTSKKIIYVWNTKKLLAIRSIQRNIIQRSDSLFIEIAEYKLKDGIFDIIDIKYPQNMSEEEYYENWGYQSP